MGSRIAHARIAATVRVAQCQKKTCLPLLLFTAMSKKASRTGARAACRWSWPAPPVAAWAPCSLALCDCAWRPCCLSPNSYGSQITLTTALIQLSQTTLKQTLTKSLNKLSLSSSSRKSLEQLSPAATFPISCFLLLLDAATFPTSSH